MINYAIMESLIKTKKVAKLPQLKKGSIPCHLQRQRYKFWKVLMMLLLNLGANTSFS